MKTTLWRPFVLFFLFITCFLQQQLYATDSSAVIITSTAVASVPMQSYMKPFAAVYIDDHAALLTDIKERNSKTFTVIQTVLVNRGVPAQLLYLAVVESKLKNTATSGAGAGGVWQLMPATARSLGLKVNGKTDQRRNIYQSTVAAADYLHKLYEEFDDWLLVIAAYNCGSGNVYKAIKQSGSRDFKKLQQFLPKETRDHVKRFIATHFYYEGEGSLVTLTKTERFNYLSSLEKALAKETANSNSSFSGTASVNFVLMMQDEGQLQLVMRK
jgi:membrane-bound lytic murein transglycosylase D